jgi:hypothetical protein
VEAQLEPSRAVYAHNESVDAQYRDVEGLLQTVVADLHHFEYHVDAGPDPALYFIADQVQLFNLMRIQIRIWIQLLFKVTESATTGL